jgi:hypothetical protein
MNVSTSSASVPDAIGIQKIAQRYFLKEVDAVRKMGWKYPCAYMVKLQALAINQSKATHGEA